MAQKHVHPYMTNARWWQLLCSAQACIAHVRVGGVAVQCTDSCHLGVHGWNAARTEEGCIFWLNMCCVCGGYPYRHPPCPRLYILALTIQFWHRHRDVLAPGHKLGAGTRVRLRTNTVQNGTEEHCRGLLSTQRSFR